MENLPIPQLFKLLEFPVFKTADIIIRRMLAKFDPSMLAEVISSHLQYKTGEVIYRIAIVMLADAQRRAPLTIPIDAETQFHVTNQAKDFFSFQHLSWPIFFMLMKYDQENKEEKLTQEIEKYTTTKFTLYSTVADLYSIVQGYQQYNVGINVYNNAVREYVRTSHRYDARSLNRIFQGIGKQFWTDVHTQIESKKVTTAQFANIFQD